MESVGRVGGTSGKTVRDICSFYEKEVVTPRIEKLKEEFDSKLQILEDKINLLRLEIGELEVDSVKVDNTNSDINVSINVGGTIKEDGVTMEEFINEMSNLVIKSCKELLDK